MTFPMILFIAFLVVGGLLLISIIKELIKGIIHDIKNGVYKGMFK